VGEVCEGLLKSVGGAVAEEDEDDEVKTNSRVYNGLLQMWAER
jgi:hypothetical protein